MAETLTIARPYAKAAFEQALATEAMQNWSDALALFAGLFGDEVVRAVCRDPDLTAEARAQTLLDLAGITDEGQCNFVKLLSKNGRLALLPEIHEQFEHRRSEHNQAIQVRAVSAYPLTPEQLAQLSQRLEKRFSRKVQIETEVDASLIGGILIHAGDKVIDGSIRGRIGQLADTILS